MVRRRRRVAQRLDAGREHDLHRDLSRRDGRDGDGLAATYFNNADFTGTTVVRTDPTVNFDWGSGSPAPAIGADTFSARWTGQVQPQFSETYTFYTQSDDGVRLWVNNVLS